MLLAVLVVVAFLTMLPLVNEIDGGLIVHLHPKHQVYEKVSIFHELSKNVTLISESLN